MVRHGRMAPNPVWDTEKLGSHAPRVGAGEPGAAAATRLWKARQPRPRLRETDRIFWVLLSKLGDELAAFAAGGAAPNPGWLASAWFRRCWAWKSRRQSRSTDGRDGAARADLADAPRQPLWGAPRIH